MSGFSFGDARWLTVACAAVALLLQPSSARAQAGAHSASRHSDSPSNSNAIDSLVARAIAVSPALAAARQRVDAARARIGPAGARPDPMLFAGIQNQPLGSEATTVSANGIVTPGGPDPMTMRTIGVSQTIPFPGKLGLRTQAAEREVDVAAAALDDARLGVVRDVRTAYYELAYLDQALRITEQERTVLSNGVGVTESHYSVGGGMEQDVLKARLEIARLADNANALRERRAAQLAALNALLDRPSEAAIDSATIPVRIAHAAVADSANRVRFASNVFGAPASNSPLPDVQALQAMAIANSAMLREHEARIAAQASRVALAEKATRPDVDVSVQYEQRSGFTDMVTATVSVPIAIQHGRKQDADIAAERAELEALQEEHHANLNELRSQVAKLYADLERQRTQLALDVTSILPQGRAAVAATTATYEAGKTDLLTLFDSQSALYAYESAYYRSLSDFSETLAELESVVGREVLP